MWGQSASRSAVPNGKRPAPPVGNFRTSSEQKAQCSKTHDVIALFTCGLLDEACAYETCTYEACTAAERFAGLLVAAHSAVYTHTHTHTRTHSLTSTHSLAC